MAKQRQDDQLELTYSSSVPIWDVVLKTSRKQWMIGMGGERGSGIYVLIVRHDDDDIVFWLYTALQYRSNIEAVEFPYFPYFWWYFIKTGNFLVFNFS